MKKRKIGLALSGGGFRASVFHIGVLTFLAEKKQLENNLKRALAEVESIKNKIANIEKTQSKKLKSLKDQEKSLTDFLGENYINSKNTKKRKY